MRLRRLLLVGSASTAMVVGGIALSMVPASAAGGPALSASVKICPNTNGNSGTASVTVSASGLVVGHTYAVTLSTSASGAEGGDPATVDQGGNLSGTFSIHTVIDAWVVGETDTVTVLDMTTGNPAVSKDVVAQGCASASPSPSHSYSPKPSTSPSTVHSASPSASVTTSHSASASPSTTTSHSTSASPTHVVVTPTGRNTSQPAIVPGNGGGNGGVPGTLGAPAATGGYGTSGWTTKSMTLVGGGGTVALLAFIGFVFTMRRRHAVADSE